VQLNSRCVLDCAAVRSASTPKTHEAFVETVPLAWRTFVTAIPNQIADLQNPFDKNGDGYLSDR